MNKKAFSLIELMVVIAIIALLAAIALPLYQNFACKSRASEPVKILADIKGSISGYVSTDVDFSNPQVPWSDPEAFALNLGVRLPKGRWNFTADAADPKILTVTVEAVSGQHPQCLDSFSFVHEAHIVATSGLLFRISATANPRYIRTTDLQGRI